MIKKYSQLNKVRYSTGGYVSVSVDALKAAEIHKAVFSRGIVDGLPPEEYHVTVMYDRNNPDISLSDIPKPALFEASIIGLDVLGEGKSKALVLLLDSPELHEFHNTLLEEGFQHSYSTFTPHVSVKYAPSESDIRIANKYLLKLLSVKNISSMLLYNPTQNVIEK